MCGRLVLLLFELDFGFGASLYFLDDVDHGFALEGRPVPDAAAIVILNAATIADGSAAIWQRVKTLVAINPAARSTSCSSACSAAGATYASG